MTPPDFLLIALNRSCNLRCQHCQFWTLDEHPDAMTANDIDGILHDFAAMNPAGKVVTCGGEASLSPKFWPSCASIRKHGLRLLKVTNGTTIKTPADAERWVTEGPHEINVSLDGPTADSHDEQRGVVGSFEKVLRALTYLTTARDKHNPDAKINIMALIARPFEGAIGHLYQLGYDVLGVDSVKLNIMQPSFGSNHDRNDEWFIKNFPLDPEGLIEEIVTQDSLRDIKRNPEWLDDVRNYFASIIRLRTLAPDTWASLRSRTTRQLCNSAARNIWVNDLGGMTLCPSPVWPGRAWKGPGDLAAFWTEQTTLDQRTAMLGCKRLCGISHSVRKNNGTLKVAS